MVFRLGAALEPELGGVDEVLGVPGFTLDVLMAASLPLPSRRGVDGVAKEGLPGLAAVERVDDSVGVEDGVRGESRAVAFRDTLLPYLLQTGFPPLLYHVIHVGAEEEGGVGGAE